MLGRFLIRLLTAVGTGVALHLAFSAWLAKGRSAPVLPVEIQPGKAEEAAPLPPLGAMDSADIRSGSALFRKAALEWTRHSPRETALWAGGLQDPLLRSAALSVIMNAWASHNLEAALFWSAQLPSDDVEPFLPLCDRLRLVSHPRVLNWAESQKSPQVRRILIDRALTGWSAFDVLAATDACLKFPEPQERARRLQLISQSWFRRAPGSALRWMSDPAHLQVEMLHSCFYAWCQNDEAAARQWMASSWRNLPVPFLGFAAASLSEKNADAFEATLHQLDGEWKIQACQALAFLHCRKDMPKAKSLLGQIPVARRGDIERNLINGLASQEPSRLAAIARACKLTSPELVELCRAWAKIQPKDCFAWIKELSLPANLKKIVATRSPGQSDEITTLATARLAALLDGTALPSQSLDAAILKTCDQLATDSQFQLAQCWRICASQWAASGDAEAVSAAFSISSPAGKSAFISGLLDAPRPAEIATLQQTIISLPENLRLPLARRLVFSCRVAEFRTALDFAEEAGLVDADSLGLILRIAPVDEALVEINKRRWHLSLAAACRAAVLAAAAAKDPADATRRAEKLPAAQRQQALAAIAASLPENRRSAWIASRPESERPGLREALESLKK